MKKKNIHAYLQIIKEIFFFINKNESTEKKLRYSKNKFGHNLMNLAHKLEDSFTFYVIIRDFIRKTQQVVVNILLDIILLKR